MTADTLASLLLDRAEDDRPGLMFEDTTWSWREHVAACRATGAWLPAQGAGAHVGVLCDNVPELVFLVGAAALGGPVVVAPNPTRAVGEPVRDARATDVSLLLAGDPYGPAARTVAEVWLRTPGGFRLRTDADVKGTEEEFVRHGRHHLLER
ncbi:hypothetical protein E1267_20135 [Nonomuraea longispora]|uniref:Long-chain fatty acid--CoA ligase n=1 Tax=Nonomuraea longispora TaxID=1848320 RepID=A0A4R4NDJ8_9ACTN|nr:AMP-binding protein [Nonomuraea longispora]TDC05237.1 hypothetical protein E1267_20135 [Nonomuraea longispora]